MKKVLYVFLRILIALLVLVVFVSGIYKYSLSDTDVLCSSILTSEYDASILSAVSDSLYNQGDEIGLDSNALYSALDKKQVLDYSHSYTRVYIESVLENKKFEFDEYYSQSLKENINAMMHDFVAQTEGAVYKQEDTDSVYNAIIDVIYSTLDYIPNIALSYSSKAASIISKFRFLNKLFLPSCMLLLSSIAAYITVSRRHSVITRFARVAMSVWLPVAAIFIPALMFRLYDSSSKIMLSCSPLYYLLSGIIRALQNNVLLVSGIAFVIFTVMLVVTMYYSIKRHCYYSVHSYDHE